MLSSVGLALSLHCICLLFGIGVVGDKWFPPWVRLLPVQDIMVRSDRHLAGRQDGDSISLRPDSLVLSCWLLLASLSLPPLLLHPVEGKEERADGAGNQRNPAENRPLPPPFRWSAPA